MPNHIRKRDFSKNKKIRKLKTEEIEIEVATYFNIRRNLIIPNIWWGMGFRHECDLLVLSKAGCATEIEIKITKADLMKDKEKGHGHYEPKIQRLFFAIPGYLEKYTEHIPEHAGIIIVGENSNETELECIVRRNAKIKSRYKFADEERLKLAELGSMRIWGLKKKLNSQRLRSINHAKENQIKQEDTKSNPESI